MLKDEDYWKGKYPAPHHVAIEDLLVVVDTMEPWETRFEFMKKLCLHNNILVAHPSFQRWAMNNSARIVEYVEEKKNAGG